MPDHRAGGQRAVFVVEGRVVQDDVAVDVELPVPYDVQEDGAVRGEELDALRDTPQNTVPERMRLPCTWLAAAAASLRSGH